jgi:hypothetical protein
VRRILGVALVALAVAAPARAGGPSLIVGAAEDNVRQSTLTAAKAKLDLLKLAGMSAVRVTSIWDPASPLPDTGELTALRNVSAAAKLDGMQMFTSVYNFGSRTTPLTEDAQASFANYAATLAREVPDMSNFIIGNEPNINRFWLPQFTAAGSDAAAPADLSQLYRTYTALKGVNPSI